MSKAREIIERVTKDAIELAIVRHSLVPFDGEEIDEDAIVQDVTGCTTGDDIGCAEPEELNAENSTSLFVQARIEELLAAQRELDCRAVCALCRYPESADGEVGNADTDDDGEWVHRLIAMPWETFPCVASPIRRQKEK
jgi:hypothetical protein